MARFQNACKRTLILVLLTWGTIFFVPVSALANGVITVTTPLNGAIVTVPFDVQFTYSGTDTYTKLWIDGVPTSPTIPGAPSTTPSHRSPPGSTF